MTIIIVPTEKCNYRCSYCFEPEKQRKEGEGFTYNYKAIEHSLMEVWNGPYSGSDVCLHGGEPLLTSLPELEKLMSLIFNLPWKRKDGSVGVKGSVSLVTNASLITDEHIKLFKKYNVYPGVSIDGSIGLNLLRGTCPLIDERIHNVDHRRVIDNIRKMRKNDLPVSIMCMLHKYSASTPEQLKKLAKWMLDLKKIGILGGRANAIYGGDYELTNHQIHRAWINIYNWNKKYGLRWNPVIEMEKNLRGEKGRHNYFFPKPCVHNRCDPFNTHTLSILPDGTIGCCDRTFAHGIYCRSLSGTKSGRYEALAQTDCKGCKYWGICGGGCPEEGFGDDWRRKTRFCEAIYKTYEYIEKKLREKNPNIELMIGIQEEIQYGEAPHGDKPHGDSTHGDNAHGDSGHGDLPHGDLPHGDSTHGDSADWRE